MITRSIISSLCLLAGGLHAQSPELELHYAYDFSEGSSDTTVDLDRIISPIPVSGNMQIISSDEHLLRYTDSTDTLSGTGSALDVTDATLAFKRLQVNPSTGYVLFLQFNLLDLLCAGASDQFNVMNMDIGGTVWDIGISNNHFTITGVESGDIALALTGTSPDGWMTLVMRNGASLSGSNNQFDINLYGSDTSELAATSFTTNSNNPMLKELIFGDEGHTAMLIDNIAIYDGVLDSGQYQSLVSQTGSGIIPTDFTVIPEPATLTLGGLGLALLLKRRRRGISDVRDVRTNCD